MFCTHCGKELPDGVRFCTGCGAELKAQAKPAQSMFQEAPDPELNPQLQQDTFVEETPPIVPAPAAPEKKKRRRAVWPWVLALAVLLLAGAVCAVLFIPALHDAVFGVEEIDFSEDEVALFVGDKLDLTEDLDAGKRSKGDLDWSSSDEDVATVNKNGVVTAVGVGECTITVEDREHDDVYDEITVTVSEKVLAFTDTELTLEVGDEVQLDDYLHDENVDFDGAKWSISDANVVDWTEDDHVIRAKDAGTAVVTVEADGMKASVTVTVEKEPEPEPDPVDVQAAVEEIRSWYYSPDANSVRREANSGDNGWNYAREYLFHDGELVFAYLTDSSAQIRLYFRDGKLIFAIDTDRSEYTGSDLSRFQALADQALSDAQSYAP